MRSEDKSRMSLKECSELASFAPELPAAPGCCLARSGQRRSRIELTPLAENNRANAVDQGRSRNSAARSFATTAA
jgi:hypothetical protein